MKKQFNRMKQLANQTVGRAEKTEVLSDDLLQIERRMELMRVVSHNTHKKMASCLQGHVAAEAEKRHSVPRLYPGNGQRKLPLTAVSQAMLDGGAQLGDDSPVGKMLEVCGEAESRLAAELLQHELRLEQEVLDPLSQLAEVEIPNILKQRKHLAKLVLDYDSARARWLQATKSIISGSNTQALAAKADLLKEEMDEAMNKVELCKDQLAADMYSFFSREGDFAQHFITLLEAQADFHRTSLSVLDGVLPAIRAQQDSWMEKPAFGTALDDHLKRSGRDIAVPMEACVMMLLETGMKEEGLFRVTAGASKLKKLKAALDCSTSQLEEFYSDPHAVAGALKSYLRDLPDPLMTSDLYDEWIQASSVSDPDKRLQALWLVCDKLPKNNRNNLRYLVKFLARLAQDSESNKMTPSNMAIVLGPSLLWAPAEGSLADMAAASSVQAVAILEPIIQHADWFFPEDVEFNVSGVFVMPAAPSNHSVPPDGDGDRRRSVAMGDDAARRDSSTRQADPPLRRGTLGRKQLISPAFQPPLPPLEAPSLGHGVPQGPQDPQVDPQPPPPVGGSGLDGPQLSLVQDLAAAQQLLAQDTEELSLKQRDGAAPAPGPQRDGSGAAGPSGPSPHMTRRGTKKQAPPPPSPVAPPPCCGPAAPPRRPPVLPPLQAPSHPPPAPPGPQPWTDPEPEPSPPGTPTPPDSPPAPPGAAGPDAVPTRSGSLPRPRPVPKPRNRPGGPPPPGKMAEPLAPVRPSRASVAELPVDQQLAAANANANASSCDLDTESTAL